MLDVPPVLWELLGMVATAGAVYGGIRADLRALHAKAEAAQRTADAAHQRLDALILSSRP